MGRKRTSKNRHLPPNMHRKGASYYLVTWDGSRQKWRRLAADYATALVEYSRLLVTGLEPKTKFRDLAAEYVLAEYDQLRPRTRDNYARALQRLLDYFGDAPVREITPAHVGRYMDLRSSKNAANTEKAVLSKILGLGVRWGWCEENVARKIGYHKTTRRRTVISRAEWQAIKLASNSDLIPVFMDLAYCTGLRVGDVLALQWKQVTAEGLYVLQGKNRVEGMYELTDGLNAILQRARRLHGRKNPVAPLIRPETTIIHTRALKPYTYYGFRSIWRNTVGRAKLERIRIHDIRRTAITAAKQAGRIPSEFSLHRTEAEAAAYVVEVPRVQPLELIK